MFHVPTLPSLKVPPIFLLKKAFLKEHERNMGGTFKEGRVSFPFLGSLSFLFWDTSDSQGPWGVSKLVGTAPAQR